MRDRGNWIKYLCTAGMLAVVTLGMTGCDEAKSAYKDGLAFMEKADYESAATCFETAIKENDEKAEYYIAYGMALLKGGDAKSSIKVFGKAILSTDNKIVHENNKQAYKGRGIAYYECHEYELAIEDFENALKISEKEEMNAELLELKADAEKTFGNYEAALDSYEKLLKLDDKNENAYLNRASLETVMEDYDAAIADYDAVIKLNKKNYNAYFGKYDTCLAKGDEGQAMQALEVIMSLEMKTTEDKYNVARAYFYKGDYGTAEVYLNEVIEAGDSKAWYFLGQINQSKPDYDKAIEQYEQYIAGTDVLDSAMVYNQLAGCYMEKEDYVSALGAALEGLKLEDRSVRQALTYNTIIIYEKLGEFKKARKMAKDYIKAYPDDESVKRELDFIKTRIADKAKKPEDTKEDDETGDNATAATGSAITGADE